MEPRLEQLGVKVQLLVSDRAKVLIKWALSGLECEHNADIFHGLRDISKLMGSILGRRKGTTKRHLDKYELKLEKAKERGASSTIIESKVEQVEQARAQDQAATQDLDNYRGKIRKMSITVHPFKLEDNKPQDSANVQNKLLEQAKDIEAMARKSGIKDHTGMMKKSKNQIKELVPSIDFWWLYVLTNLIRQGERSKELLDWAMFSLLPTVYWGSIRYLWPKGF